MRCICRNQQVVFGVAASWHSLQSTCSPGEIPGHLRKPMNRGRTSSLIQEEHLLIPEKGLPASYEACALPAAKAFRLISRTFLGTVLTIASMMVDSLIGRNLSAAPSMTRLSVRLSPAVTASCVPSKGRMVLTRLLMTSSMSAGYLSAAMDTPMVPIGRVL